MRHICEGKWYGSIISYEAGVITELQLFVGKWLFSYVFEIAEYGCGLRDSPSGKKETVTLILTAKGGSATWKKKKTPVSNLNLMEWEGIKIP